MTILLQGLFLEIFFVWYHYDEEKIWWGMSGSLVWRVIIRLNEEGTWELIMPTRLGQAGIWGAWRETLPANFDGQANLEILSLQ